MKLLEIIILLALLALIIGGIAAITGAMGVTFPEAAAQAAGKSCLEVVYNSGLVETICQ